MLVFKLLLIGGLVAFTIYEIVAIIKQIRSNKKARTEQVEADEKKAK